MVRWGQESVFLLCLSGVGEGLNQDQEVHPGVKGSERPSTYPQRAWVPQGLSGVALCVIVVKFVALSDLEDEVGYAR